MKMMNGLVSWYVLLLAPLRITYFVLLRLFCFFLFFLFFLVFLVSLLPEVLREVWRYLKYSSGVVSRFLSGASRGELLQLHLLINVTGLVEPTEPGSVWEKF